jgi:hypothetical protein
MAYCGLHKNTFADDDPCPFCFPVELEDDESEDEYEFLDCHMDRNGFCGKAGSEECEFECPYRADQRKEQSK